jgi:Methyl-accepting chemotaxis protein (MCP) signalling domain
MFSGTSVMARNNVSFSDAVRQRLTGWRAPSRRCASVAEPVSPGRASPDEAGAASAPAATNSAMIERIATESGRLGVELADINGAVEDLAAAVSSHATDFAQLQESSAGIAANGRRIAETAATARSVVSHARETAEASQHEVRNSLDEIRSLAGTVGAIEAQLGGLRDALAEVGNAARNINVIAGQTNLLALNATIEAARAGDAADDHSILAGCEEYALDDIRKALMVWYPPGSHHPSAGPRGKHME